MQFKDWTTLKTAGKVAFKKEDKTNNSPGYIYLERKVYNTNTGAESIVKDEITLAYLENEKAKKTAKKTALTTEITEIGKMITQIKKV